MGFPFPDLFHTVEELLCYYGFAVLVREWGRKKSCQGVEKCSADVQTRDTLA